MIRGRQGSSKVGRVRESHTLYGVVGLSALLFGLLVGGNRPWAFGFRTLTNSGAIVESSSDEKAVEPIVWAIHEVPFALQFDGQEAPSHTSLLNESSSWNENAREAFEAWNGAGAHFSWREGAEQVPLCEDSALSPDEINSTGWSEDYCGVPWGQDVLAVTEVTYTVVSINGVDQAHIVDTNIIMNSSERWDAYEGSVILTTSSGEPIFDFSRVMLHELGHALGLVHPDEVGQSLQAIMNSREDGTFQLMTDDLNGINRLYPTSLDVEGQSAGSETNDSNGSLEQSGGAAGTESASPQPEDDAPPTINRSSGGGGSLGVFHVLLLALGLSYRLPLYRRLLNEEMRKPRTARASRRLGI